MNRIPQYIIIIFTFHVNLFAQGTWESVESPTNQTLTSVHFVDSLYGWAAGVSGTIIHSDDGGNNWVFQNSKTENTIADVFFLNRNLGWASSWNTSVIPFGTLLLKTTDGGQNWISESYRDDNLFMTSILFLDSLNGWMVGKPHSIVKTTNGGISWAQAEIDTSLFAFFPVFNIKFYNSHYGYACGGAIDAAGVVWSTSNGGDNWFAINPLEAPPDPISQVHIFDSVNVIGMGGDRELFGVGLIRTSDGGLFWEYEDIGIQGFGLTLDFRTENEAWSALGGQQKFIYSSDSGATWIQIPTPDSSTIIDVIFPDSLHGFAVGRDGVILKYKPPLVDAVSDYHPVIPEFFELYQNYPNPFNPTTTIKYSLPEDGFVNLTVFNMLGEEIKTLVNSEQKSGNYEVEFSAKGGSASGGNAWSLPSGIYFYRLHVVEFVETKKMLLLK